MAIGREFTEQLYYGQFEGSITRYDADASYAIGDLVEFGGNIFRSLIAPNMGITPVSGTDWELQEDTTLGYYQYISLDDLVNNFMFLKTGEDTMLGKMNRNKVAGFMQRTIQELNYDVLRVERSQQIELNLTTRAIALPQDCVNLIQVSWLDSAGNKHPMLPTYGYGGQNVLQDDDFRFLYDDTGSLMEASKSNDVTRFQDPTNPDYRASSQGYFYGAGFNDFEYPYSGGYLKRYGLEPENANNNGRYFFDRTKNIIYLDDSIVDNNEAIMSIDYVSDGLYDNSKIQVKKLAEEAVYKMTEYMILQNKFGVQDFVLRRVAKESGAIERNTKIRMMQMDLPELAQEFRGQSKWIKH